MARREALDKGIGVSIKRSGMDISEIYIKMCEKAEKIQEQKGKYEDGDFLLDNDSVISWCDCCYCDDTKSLGLIWLPRQDQLQEMYGRYAANEMGLNDVSHSIMMHTFIAFSAWINGCYEDGPYVCNPTNVFDSGEQLWLAFVMKEKYNKVWDGDNWIGEK